MKVALLTREYPPEVYGGAGVHVEYLARELRALDELACTAGAPTARARSAYRAWDALAGRRRTWPRCGRCRSTSRWRPASADAELVHSHTWYANLAGHLAKLTYGIPHVVTVHSLEPLRPWKAEQLGGGYALSVFCERTGMESADAVIAVSEGMRRDVLAAYPASTPSACTSSTTASTRRVRARPRTDVLARHGVDPARRTWCSWGESRARRACRTWSRRRCSSTRPRSSCCAPARRTRPRSPQQVRARRRASCRRSAAAWSGSRRCFPSRT